MPGQACLCSWSAAFLDEVMRALYSGNWALTCDCEQGGEEKKYK
jgi:hypothetical protein